MSIGLLVSLLFCVAEGAIESLAPNVEAFEIARDDSSSLHAPHPLNLKRRKDFRDWGLGMFIHWGVYSLWGQGEWVMHHANIPIDQYEEHARDFNPSFFDAATWVQFAIDSGFKYITVTTKHHDGFAMWHTKQSPWNIVDWTRGTFGRDVIRELASECQRRNMPIFFYHSHLDWHHAEYDPATGWTGQNGRARGDFDVYLEYLDAQLRELLTDYGDIAGIWFDGWWDKPRAHWGLDQTYGLIHGLQPAALVGNNHHLHPFPGEDFQMYEKDLPGENSAGYSANARVSKLPLETCDTLHADKAWGYSLNHTAKSYKEIIHMIVRTAGYNANLLLNIGPMPTGDIQPEFVDRMREVGTWLKTFGKTIYNARAGPITPHSWGVSTQRRGGYVYLHILDNTPRKTLKLEGMGKHSWRYIRSFETHENIPFKIGGERNEDLMLKLPAELDEIDTVIEMRLNPTPSL